MEDAPSVIIVASSNNFNFVCPPYVSTCKFSIRAGVARPVLIDLNSSWRDKIVLSIRFKKS